MKAVTRIVAGALTGSGLIVVLLLAQEAWSRATGGPAAGQHIMAWLALILAGAAVGGLAIFAPPLTVAVAGLVLLVLGLPGVVGMAQWLRPVGGLGVRSGVLPGGHLIGGVLVAAAVAKALDVRRAQSRDDLT